MADPYYVSRSAFDILVEDLAKALDTPTTLKEVVPAEKEMNYFRFSDLPQELKDEIYFHALVVDEIQVLPTHKVPTYLRPNLSLLVVNRAIYNEAIKIFYSKNTFIFVHPRVLKIFEKRLGVERCKNVHRIGISLNPHLHAPHIQVYSLPDRIRRLKYTQEDWVSALDESHLRGVAYIFLDVLGRHYNRLVSDLYLPRVMVLEEEFLVGVQELMMRSSAQGKRSLTFWLCEADERHRFPSSWKVTSFDEQKRIWDAENQAE